MEPWTLSYLSEAQEDLDRLDGSVRKVVLKSIDKVCLNPLPYTEGGYGKPLGNKMVSDLTGLLKVKLKGNGIRIIYRLDRTGSGVLIVIIGIRDDSFVYKEAGRRRKKHNL